MEILSRHCQECKMKKASGMSDEDFEEWYRFHEKYCQLNHDESAGCHGSGRRKKYVGALCA